jgi:hypothetical protein
MEEREIELRVKIDELELEAANAVAKVRRMEKMTEVGEREREFLRESVVNLYSPYFCFSRLKTLLCSRQNLPPRTQQIRAQQWKGRKKTTRLTLPLCKHKSNASRSWRTCFKNIKTQMHPSWKKLMP